VVVSVHDVSFLEHPEYFTRDRAWQLQLERPAHRAPRRENSLPAASFRARPS